MLYGMLPKYALNLIKREEIRDFRQLKQRLTRILEVYKSEKALIGTLKTMESVISRNNKNSKINLEKPKIIANGETAETPVPEETVRGIKVRRTEDLMPVVKEEPAEIAKVHANDAKTVDVSQPAEFQIDNELMNQITHIIDNCEQDISLHSVADENKTLQNLESTDNKKPNVIIEITPTGSIVRCASQQVNVEKPKSSQETKSGSKMKKKRKRKYTAERWERLKSLTKLTSEAVINIDHEETPRNDNNPVTTTATLVAPTPTSSNAMPIQVHLSTIPLPPPTSSSNVMATTTETVNTPSTSTNNATKLLTPSIVAAPAKPQISKLWNEPSPAASLKCHQCGMLGYYRSICPNCSPIYFYKPSSGYVR